MKHKSHFYLISFMFLVMMTISCRNSAAITDTISPVVVLDYSESYTFQSVSGIIEIEALVTDANKITGVEFFILANDTPQTAYFAENPPFIFQWDTTQLEDCSTYQLYAVATDEYGNSGESILHSFNVDNSFDSDLPVEVWLTNGLTGVGLSHQTDRYFGTNCLNSNLVEIHDDVTYQEIDGFGAALTHSSALLINNDPDRDLIIEKLFSKSEGIGMTYIRLAIGASDFVQGPQFSYDDMFGDTDLSEFSLDPDREDIIPIIQDALALNPDIQIVASPWSAPGWMKTSGSMIGGELKTQYYTTYADYFVRYITEYLLEGITIDAVTIQNEPGYVPWNYPGMYMNSQAQKIFIRDALGPAFETNNIDTKILVFDHNWGWDPDFVSGSEFVLDIYSDPDAARYIDGSAWHGYGGDVTAQSIVHNAYPEKNVYFTERTNSTIWEGWDGVLGHMSKYYFIDVLKNWSKNVLLWNIALDSENGPHNGGCDNCTGLLTIDNGSLSYEIDYFMTGQFSKFIEPGAVRIGVTDNISDFDAVSFINPDGSHVLVALNNGYNPISFYIVWNNMSFLYSLPGQSLVTFTW